MAIRQSDGRDVASRSEASRYPILSTVSSSSFMQTTEFSALLRKVLLRPEMQFGVGGWHVGDNVVVSVTESKLDLQAHIISSRASAFNSHNI